MGMSAFMYVVCLLLFFGSGLNANPLQAQVVALGLAVFWMAFDILFRYVPWDPERVKDILAEYA
jgi:hypothetical protein